MKEVKKGCGIGVGFFTAQMIIGIIILLCVIVGLCVLFAALANSVPPPR